MCRPFAFNTFAVHLNPFTRDGRMWVAQRSFKKAIGPGYWDNCAAGLVGAGEPFGLAMEREAFEEAGVTPGSLEISFRRAISFRVPFMKAGCEKSLTSAMLMLKTLSILTTWTARSSALNS